jgi:hypothetical protein
MNNIVFDKDNNVNKKKKEKIKSLTTYSLWQSIRSLKQLYIRILYPFSKYIGLWHADYPFHSGALISIELVTNIRIKNHTFIKAFILNAKNKTFGTSFFSMDPLYTVDALDYVIEKVPFFEISIKPSEDTMEGEEEESDEEEEDKEKNEEEFIRNKNLLEKNLINYVSDQKININLIKSKLMNNRSIHLKYKKDNHYEKTIDVHSNKNNVNAHVSGEDQASLLLNGSTSSTSSTKSQSILKETNQTKEDTITHQKNDPINPNINITINYPLNNSQECNILKNTNSDLLIKINDSVINNDKSNITINEKNNINNNLNDNNDFNNNNNNSNKNKNNSYSNNSKKNNNDKNNNYNNNNNDNKNNNNNNNNDNNNDNDKNSDINIEKKKVSDDNINENQNSNTNNKHENKLTNDYNICPSPIPIPNSKKLSQYNIENGSHRKHNTPMKREDLRILFTESYIPKSSSHQKYYNHSYYTKSYSRFLNNNIYNSFGVKSYYNKYNYFNSKSMASYYNNNPIEKENTNKRHDNNNNINNNKENNGNKNNNNNSNNNNSNNNNSNNNSNNNNNNNNSNINNNNNNNNINDNNHKNIKICEDNTFKFKDDSVTSSLSINASNSILNNNNASTLSNKINIKNNNNISINNNKNYLNNSSSNLNNSLTPSAISQNNLIGNHNTNKSSNIKISNSNDNDFKNDNIDSIDFYHNLINKSNIKIFNYYNPNFCIKKEKVPFTINISYTSCSHPVKLILSPSSDIAFLNEIPNEHTGLWTSKKSFHVLQPSLITVIQTSEMNENNFENYKNNSNKYNIFNLSCSEGCHLNKVRSLSIVDDKTIYGNFLYNTSYSKINLLLSSQSVKKSKSISLSNIKSDIDLTYSTTLSNSYPLTHNRSSFSILTSALTSFHTTTYSSSSYFSLSSSSSISSSNATLISSDFNSSSIPCLDGIWIGTFGHHGLEFIYIKTYDKKISDSSKKDSLITLQNEDDEEVSIMINTEEYSNMESEENSDEVSHTHDNYFSRSFHDLRSIDLQNENENEDNEMMLHDELTGINKSRQEIVAYKITGDVNIPKGEISWSADLSHTINSEMTTLDGRVYDITQSNEFQNSKIYKAEGIFAQIGYRDIKKRPGKLIVISQDEIAIFWETIYRISRFKRYL